MPERIVDIQGVAMVVTDLHGAGDVYIRLRDAFLTLKARGEVDVLVICGDLIHPTTNNDPDDSLPMLLDVMRLQRELGEQHVVMLLGNHELPHIYSISLVKGDMLYTPPFEAALAALGAAQRQQVIAFLAGLPFYARTQAGVLLTHAGAAAELTSADNLRRLLALDHLALIADTQAQMERYGIDQLRTEYEQITRVSYDRDARRLLAVTGETDARYHDLLRAVVISESSAEFRLLWEALFIQKEDERRPTVYDLIVEQFLQRVTELSANEQRVLVAGHIGVRNGYKVLGTQKLRLATYAHANPRDSGRYLIFDTAKRVEAAADLVDGLRLTARV